MRSDPTLKKWYRIFNKKWFDNKLPDNTKVLYSSEFEGEEGTQFVTFGETELEKDKAPIIRINPLLRDLVMMKTIVVETLLHEMGHIEETRLNIQGDHGPGWERIMLKLATKGAFSKHNGVVKNSLW